jgi:hypothetical protein
MNPGRYYHRYIKGKVLTNVSAFFNTSKCCPFCAGITVRFVQVMLYAAYYVADKHNILLHNAP